MFFNKKRQNEKALQGLKIELELTIGLLENACIDLAASSGSGDRLLELAFKVGSLMQKLNLNSIDFAHNKVVTLENNFFKIQNKA